MPGLDSTSRDCMETGASGAGQRSFECETHSRRATGGSHAEVVRRSGIHARMSADRSHWSYALFDTRESP